MLRARRDTESQEGYLTIWKIPGAKRNAGFEIDAGSLKRYQGARGEIFGARRDTGN